jgi:hypothetical protein
MFPHAAYAARLVLLVGALSKTTQCFKHCPLDEFRGQKVNQRKREDAKACALWPAISGSTFVPRVFRQSLRVLCLSPVHSREEPLLPPAAGLRPSDSGVTVGCSGGAFS